MNAMQRTFRNALKQTQRTSKPAYVMAYHCRYAIADAPDSNQSYYKVTAEAVERYIYNPRESKHELKFSVATINDLQF